MKKTILFFAAFAALASCTKENLPDNSQSAESFAITLEATAPSTSGDDTKTTLIDHSLVHWTKGDAIKVGFYASYALGKAIENKTGVFTSTFEYEVSKEALFSIDTWNWHYSDGRYDDNAYLTSGLAMYPSDVHFSSTRQSGVASVPVYTEVYYTIPSNQTAVESSFEPDLCFSTAEVNKTDFIENAAKLAFKNECALIKIVLPEGVNEFVSVNVASNSGTPIVGKFYYNKTTVPSFPISFDITDEVDAVNLNAPENETLNGGAVYYMVACPGEHKDGLTFVFKNAEGKTSTKKLASKVVLEKSKIDEFKFKMLDYDKELSYDDAKVGDYFYADGTFSSEPVAGKDPVGIVFYTSDGVSANMPTTIDAKLAAACAELGEGVGTHGLVVSCSYQSSTPYYTRFDKDWITSYGGTMTGYADTKILIEFLSTKKRTPGSYGYAPSLDYINTFSTVENASAWYLPTVAECAQIKNVLTTINSKLGSVNKNSLPGDGNYCCTVTTDTSYSDSVVLYDLSDGDKFALIKSNTSINMTAFTLPIFAF